MSRTARQRAYGRGRIFRRREGGVEVGNYLLAYYVNGRQVQESTRTTDPKVATQILNERVAAVGAGTAPEPGLYRITVNDLLDDLESRHEVERRPSLRTTRTHLVALRPPLGAIRAVDLRTKHLEKFVAACRTAGYAEATIGRFLDTLHAALGLGRKATPPKVAAIPAFPTIDESDNVRQGFATLAQVAVLLDTLQQRDPDLADFVAWKAWTGMRKGAVSGLRWDQWDAETATLRLPPAGRKKRAPKTIPLRPGHPLRAILDRRWDRRRERAKETGRLEPLIFWRVHRGGRTATGLRPGDAAPIYEMRKAFAAAARAAGLPTLTPHDLRRTAIRNVWHATRDRRLVKLLSAHATDSMVDRYNIGTDEELGRALDAVAVYVDAPPADRQTATVTALRARQGHRRRPAKG